MALVLADRVRETTTVTGTGTATLLGAVSGYQSFSAVGNANTTYYVIANQSASEWEVGIGTYTSSGTTLSRDTVLSSSNGGSLVNFSAGTKDVFVDYPASKAVYEDASDIVTGYAITGGTINGTTVGATTPAAGTFTTLTAQTEVLKGTGQNLLVYSNTFNNTTGWNNVLSLPLTTGQTDPFGGSNATLLSYNTQYQSLVERLYTCIAGITYTASIWAKTASGTRTFSITGNNTGAVYGNYTATTTWTRYSVTFTPSASDLIVFAQDRNASGFVNASIYGAQLEIGSIANTYQDTTTTAVYGTPTLSFSGVSTIGLQSDGSLYVSPAGTGALQAQATTSSATGGNARGANAVDWQTLRSGASSVASGSYSVIGGGYNNSASGFTANIAGGYGNTSNNFTSFVGGGQSNTASNQGASISGGASNTASNWMSTLGGGYGNTSGGAFNFIGGGQANSGTANAAVTTQSGTMNATTAVTLSGSNASIKVGQYITGTSIATNTYVAAVSGTSLTLSQAASGSSTSTLSFFTPHGVVVGGGNNQATGSYSFIGGGGDAGTAANRNVASGDRSVVVGGVKNTASGEGSFVGGGGSYSGGTVFPNTASGNVAVVVGGINNTSSALGSFVGGGYNNISNGTHSVVMGGVAGTTRGIIGNQVFAASSNPISGNIGVSQAALLVLGRETTNATATVLTSDNASGNSANQVILPNNSAYTFRGEIVSGVTGGGNSKSWTIEGLIKRGANAAATTLVGSTVTSMYGDAGAVTWTIGLTADTTNGGLAVTFTGQASTTIRTVCQIRTTEVTY